MSVRKLSLEIVFRIGFFFWFFFSLHQNELEDTGYNQIIVYSTFELRGTISVNRIGYRSYVILPGISYRATCFFSVEQTLRPGYIFPTSYRSFYVQTIDRILLLKNSGLVKRLHKQVTSSVHLVSATSAQLEICDCLVKNPRV